MKTQDSQQTAQHTPIKGFHGYALDAALNIVSVTANWRGYGERVISISEDSDGYPSVRLLVGGKRKRIAIHRLIAATFLAEKKPGEEIRHLDGNRWNWRPSNLAWGTRKQNADDREAHGRTSRGPTHSRAIKSGLLARATR